MLSKKSAGENAPASPETLPLLQCLLTTMAASQDTFEDAVDTGSIRSLTNRKTSLARHATRESQGPESDADEAIPSNAEEQTPNDDDESAPEPEKKSLHRLSKTSVAELDNVNLDDDTTAADKGKLNTPPRSSHAARSAHNADTLNPDSADEKTAVEKELPPSKTLSLSSITSALPSMPWSPPPTDSLAKTTSAPAPAAAAPAPQLPLAGS